MKSRTVVFFLTTSLHRLTALAVDELLYSLKFDLLRHSSEFIRQWYRDDKRIVWTVMVAVPTV